MAGGAKIGNPGGAYGQAPTPSSHVEECIVGGVAGVGVSRGDLVRLTWDATTGRVLATRTATTDPTTGRFGVAEQGAGFGQSVKVTTYGFTYVNGGANVFAVGEAILRSAVTGGHADRMVPDATTIAGTLAGTVLGVKGSAAPYPFVNAVPVFIEKF